MDKEINEAFEQWWALQGMPSHQHDAFLEAWLRGAIAAIKIDREEHAFELNRLIIAGAAGIKLAERSGI